ncbi:UDP-N-acetylmuramate dehydrogenase [Desulfovibrio sp. JC022]|uniref:UDP-N-acetylmuramate dehydrogenase n=1 Tax=Desulfovibrio sp. JC022 TaxID=2593642 RepID=UPI0013D654B4|nr:UDP-N-acetylmuramate dehydrogenase [Desulfovibrio sp. JC022]NDV21140.1 UDP-N-acetylmuramate dehydrogenase [Desulfovibrio sp. JC022]
MTLELLHKPGMAQLTSLGIGGNARVLAKVRDEAGLDELSRFVEREGSDLLAIGEGSNILAGDGELNLALVQMACERKAEAEISGTSVRVPADMRLPGLLSVLIKNGLSGMEGLAGIPGSVGGSVAMNAGSYGTDMQSSVKRVRLWTPEKGLFWKDAANLKWGYRHFSTGTDEFFLVWEVEFELAPSTEAEVRSRIKDTFDKKKATQPVTAKTAGCVFKNPEGYSAGKLLDDAGFRGRNLGGMGFSEMHANFLENKGNGTAAQALELMSQATEAVSDKFGVTLKPEVIILS